MQSLVRLRIRQLGSSRDLACRPKSRIRRAGTATAILTAILGAASAVPADAAVPRVDSYFVYTFTDAQTGRCLDSTYSGNVGTNPCNGGGYQQWVRSAANATIVDGETGRCLDSKYNGQTSTNPCNGGNYQNWAPNGSLLVDFQTRRCLDSTYSGQTGTNLCNGGNYQNWVWKFLYSY